MARSQSRRLESRPLHLGIEAGATHTVAILADGLDRALARISTGPANVRLLDDRALQQHFRELARQLPRPTTLAIGMAGARTETDRARIRKAAGLAWPGVPCLATNDLETALQAASVRSGRAPRPRQGVASRTSRTVTLPRVLVLSGTGSCCFGRADEQTAKVGGWGHLLGDKGSGYEIGLRGLKAVVHYYDRDRQWPVLGRRLLRALQLNEPNELISWAQTASKSDIAGLAVEVFQAWAKKDPIASDILHGAACILAEDAACCAAHLAPKGTPVQFVLAGSVLLRQPRFLRLVSRQLRARWPRALITPLRRESAWGAVKLARELAGAQPSIAGEPARDVSGMNLPTAILPPVDARALVLSPTEQRNPLSTNLDKLSLGSAIELMLNEEKRVPRALLAERPKIEHALRLIVRSLKAGGRLFYVGAGTSGRLGVLDASECPPTFQTEPDMVQGIIAGGQRALWEAVEGAEDDPQAGVRALEFRGVGRHDTVVGIAASGRTPFVRGALREAKRRGASTILLSFNPHARWPVAERPQVSIVPRIGPEILTGSTRLKAGSATKLLLNVFTTLSMVRLGKVLSNLMIDVKASNEKLRHRAVRIVRALTGVDAAQAHAALVKAEWQIKTACRRLGRR